MATDDTRIDLDLDALSRPEEEVRKPFAFNWKGRRIVLSDPAELDYTELLEIDHPLGFLRYTASQEDRDFLASKEGSMEGWRMGSLIERYYEHYKLDKGKKDGQRDRLGF